MLHKVIALLLKLEWILINYLLTKVTDGVLFCRQNNFRYQLFIFSESKSRHIFKHVNNIVINRNVTLWKWSFVCFFEIYTQPAGEDEENERSKHFDKTLWEARQNSWELLRPKKVLIRRRSFSSSVHMWISMPTLINKAMMSYSLCFFIADLTRNVETEI